MACGRIEPGSPAVEALSFFGFFLKIYYYLFYLFLAASSLSCGTQASLLRCAGFSLVVVCGFFSLL